MGKYTTSADFTNDLAKVVAAWGEEGFSLYDCWGVYDLHEAGFVRELQNPSCPIADEAMPRR